VGARWGGGGEAETRANFYTAITGAGHYCIYYFRRLHAPIIPAEAALSSLPLSLSLSLFRFLPSSLVFYFRLDVSAGAKAPGCVATNDEGFIGENGEDGRGPRAGRVGGGPGLLPVP